MKREWTAYDGERLLMDPAPKTMDGERVWLKLRINGIVDPRWAWFTRRQARAIAAALNKWAGETKKARKA